jgi:hypothetical protein
MPFLLCLLSLLSAFLLFQVQPMISKYILPWFGGSPGVWTTCMLFFQIVLFLGYAYAHASSRLKPKTQKILHTVLMLAAAAAFLPITPADSWKPLEDTEPIGRILLLLLRTVGLPYFLLSSTSPLTQFWFTRLQPNGRPWRLYALSNIGSLSALLTYPIFFEPRLSVQHQTWLWSGAFVLFVLLSIYINWRAAGTAAAPRQQVSTEQSAMDDKVPSWWNRVMWVALPAMASVMLLATTNHVCTDVAGCRSSGWCR